MRAIREHLYLQTEFLNVLCSPLFQEFLALLRNHPRNYQTTKSLTGGEFYEIGRFEQFFLPQMKMKVDFKRLKQVFHACMSENLAFSKNNGNPIKQIPFWIKAIMIDKFSRYFIACGIAK